MGRLRHLARSAITPLVQFALPPRCPSCGSIVARDRQFCLACWAQLDLLDKGCTICGDPGVIAGDTAMTCATCLADPPAYDTMRAAVAYGDSPRALTLKLKYGGRVGIAEMIGRALRRHMQDLDDALLVPVPLYRTRLWMRGFNQAALIARALAADAPDRLRLHTLVRVRATPYLRGLNATERAQAVRAAFRVPAAEAMAIQGRRVILVDDVYTSGATAGACAKALKRSGASEVHVRCWARVSRREQTQY
jgi:ComF family protein